MSTQRPTVLFLINSFAVGGAERVFIDDMTSLHAQGWDVHAAVLFAPGVLAHELEEKGVPLHELSYTSAFDMRGTQRLKALIQQLQVSHVLSTLNEANFAGRLVKLAGAQCILLTREANMADVKHWKYKIGDMVFGVLSDSIIAVSKAVGDSVCAYAPWLRQRIVVLYNGTDVSRPLAARKAGDRVRLLTVGSLTEKKDQAVLIRAMKQLPHEFSLTLVGTGSCEQQLRTLVTELGLQNRILFAGHVPHLQMPQLYAEHDLFVLPSKREGCPNVVSEAQAASLAVVAFAIPGMDEFVSSQSGVLVTERTPDAVAKAIRYAAGALDSLGRAGYVAVSQSRSTHTHLEALKNIMNQRQCYTPST